jgi:hypothetical protein
MYFPLTTYAVFLMNSDAQRKKHAAEVQQVISAIRSKMESAVRISLPPAKLLTNAMIQTILVLTRLWLS